MLDLLRKQMQLWPTQPGKQRGAATQHPLLSAARACAAVALGQPQTAQPQRGDAPEEPQLMVVNAVRDGAALQQRPLVRRSVLGAEQVAAVAPLARRAKRHHLKEAQRPTQAQTQ